jgi:hypothetical protein
MNTAESIAAFSAILLAALSAQAQSFQNLDFEEANPVVIQGNAYYPYAVTPASALPGWTAYIGSTTVSFVLLNDVSLEAASIDLLSADDPNGPDAIDGNYSAYLQPGTSLQGTGSYTASIVQTGLIPANAESLTFAAWQPMYATPFTVSFAGFTLTPVVLSTAVDPSGLTYDVYGVNIAPYAGETGQLEFTVYPNNYNSLLLDDIQFSSAALSPEPSPVALSAVGGLLCGARMWLKRH